MSKELISLSSLLLISNILLSIKYFYISVEFFDFDLDNIFIGEIPTELQIFKFEPFFN